MYSSPQKSEYTLLKSRNFPVFPLLVLFLLWGSMLDWSCRCNGNVAIQELPESTVQGETILYSDVSAEMIPDAALNESSERLVTDTSGFDEISSESSDHTPGESLEPTPPSEPSPPEDRELPETANESNHPTENTPESPCAAGKIHCVGTCVDPLSSTQHCGGCEKACKTGQKCLDGFCVDACFFCAPGLSVCQGQCKDLQRDFFHCGGCNVKCATSTFCDNGQCTPLRCPACPGQAQQCACSPACVDTQTNPYHCGGCDRACSPGQLCSNGSCVLGCPAGMYACFYSYCTDVSRDPKNCGGCGIACPEGRFCNQGQCVCPSNQQPCGCGCCADD